MPDDMLTFEQLNEIERRERKDDTLTDLDDDFFQQLADYLQRKRTIADRTDDREFRKIKHVVEDIVDSRQKKLVKLAFLAARTDFRADNVLPEEQEFFADIQDRIGRHREHLEEIVLPDEDTEAAPTPRRDSTTTLEETADEIAGDADTDTADIDTAVDDEDRTEGTETADDTTTASEGTESTDADGDGPASDGDDEHDESDASGDGGDTDRGSDDSEELLFGGSDGDDGTADQETGEGGADDTAGSDGPGADAGAGDVGGGPANDMVMLIATEDIPAFMGVDLEEYGPFEEGEEIQVPADNAEALLEQDRAERI